MEFKQLEMLVAVAEEGSIVRAAVRVFRTQPAVSMALAKLEKEIGSPLLLRTPRRHLRLTAAGETLCDYARRMLALRNEAAARVGRGTNRIDVSPLIRPSATFSPAGAGEKDLDVALEVADVF